MSMYAIDGGKTEINVNQIVSAHKEKGGDEWKLFMTDDKTYTVPKSDYTAIRALVGAGSGGGLPPAPPPPLPVYTIVLNGTASPA